VGEERVSRDGLSVSGRFDKDFHFRCGTLGETNQGYRKFQTKID